MMPGSLGPGRGRPVAKSAGKRGRKAPPRARRKALAPAKSDAILLKQQLAEARAQQAATAEILRAMAGAQTDAESVFKTIARNAVQLCGAVYCNVLRYDGEILHLGGFHGFKP